MNVKNSHNTGTPKLPVLKYKGENIEMPITRESYSSATSSKQVWYQVGIPKLSYEGNLVALTGTDQSTWLMDY